MDFDQASKSLAGANVGHTEWTDIVDSHGGEDVRRSGRSRTLTEKGMSYLLQTKTKQRDRAFRNVSEKSEYINNVMLESNSVKDMEFLFSHWLTMYEHFLDVYDDYTVLLSEEEKILTNEGWFLPKRHTLETFKKSVEDWIAATKASDLNAHFIKTEHELAQVLVESNAPRIHHEYPPSQASRTESRKSAGSHRSRVSRASSLASSVTAARLHEKQIKAEISAKMSALKKKQELQFQKQELQFQEQFQKQELEKAKLQLQLQEEELNLEQDMAISNAKSKVLDQFNTGEVVDRQASVTPFVESSTKPKVIDPVVRPRKFEPQIASRNPNYDQHASIYPLDPKAQDFVPHQNAFMPYVNPATESMSVVKHLKRPATELKKFAGDPLEFRAFIRQFNSKVVCHTDTDDERMNYLEQFTVGEANKIIKAYGYLDSGQGYNAAMREIEERYGNTEVIAHAFIKKALNWPVIKPDNVKALDDFAIFLQECENAVNSIEAMKILEYSENLKQLMSKLPYYLHDKWRNIVLDSKDRGNMISFHQLVYFVKREARRANDPVYGREAITACHKDQSQGKLRNSLKDHKKSYVVSSTDSKPDIQNESASQKIPLDSDKPKRPSSYDKPCLYCDNQEHSFAMCYKFPSLSFKDKGDFMKSKGLCFGCLKPGHQKKNCRNKSSCKKCHKFHPTVLHYDDKTVLPDKKHFDPDNSTQGSINFAENSHIDMGAGNYECTMAIIPVTVRRKNGLKSIQTYAFLDPGSSVSFCSESIIEQLGADGRKMKIKLDTMGSSYPMYTLAVNGLEVCNFDMTNIIALPTVYTKEKMPVSSNHIPTQDDINHWAHLNDIQLPQIDAEVGLLIGNNVPDAYSPIDIRTGPKGSPHASQTLLGWIMWNVLREKVQVNAHVYRTEIASIEQIQEIKQLDQLVKQSMNRDFPECISNDKKEHSREDKTFLQKVNSSICMVDGHFQISLPFRHDVKLPNNETQALQRLRSLERKLTKQPNFYKDYTTFMNNLLDKGYAEAVPDQDLLDNGDGKVWFLPHHGVYHPKKPDKIRVVFDCAATFQGVSLNNVLLQGPDLTNNLTGVLMRFRESQVAFMADIESMFHQVKVPEQDRNYLRFYWWPSGDLKSEPVQYRMTVHLFGAVSSPSCANLALQHTVKNNSEHFDKEVCDSMLNNFYVDDYLKSVPTVDQAVHLINAVYKLCQKGGFNLTKWICNNRDVLDIVPVDKLAKQLKDLDFDKEDLPTERALGICWSVEHDTMGFDISIQDSGNTRRRILSIVSSIYDPLGFVSPFVLPARILLQDLCRRNIEWDQEISGDDLMKWQQWLDDLFDLNRFSLPRCYQPSDFGEIATCQIHYFSDANNQGYGIVSYIRLVNTHGQIHCSFLLAKSRVCPLKKITIPRLELTAATLAVRVNSVIIRELMLQEAEVFYWTDSMTVIRYIANESTRFQTFVSNRLNIIHEASEEHQWRYVNSDLNPADDASRGLRMSSQSARTKRWQDGPQFLWKNESEWPVDNHIPKTIPDNDNEVKSVHTVIADTQVHGMNKLLLHFSNWMKLKKAVGWFLLFMEYLKNKSKHVRTYMSTRSTKQQLTNKISVLTPEIIDHAEKAIIQFVQCEHFTDEIRILRSNQLGSDKRLAKSSPLVKLNPMLENNILRVGGRLGKADISHDAKHPIILPKESPVSKLIIDSIHRATGHLGKNTILSMLRQKFWILKASQAIKSLVSKCVICLKYQGKVCDQQMAELPADRITGGEPPFTNVGIDYFGPFEVKRARSLVKRYGVIFTCLTSHAIHLEIAHTLDTDSCINAIRRFICRRGPPKVIRLDNGTNLVGSAKELRQEMEKWNKSRFDDLGHQHGFEWKFNPPSGSHFGGVWERLICAVRKIMYSLLKEQVIHMDDEGLITLFCEIENIMNNRPLTRVSDDPNDLEALTPNHLLQLRSNQSSCGIFHKDDTYARRLWRQVQYLADIFWKRWTKEYLPTLQVRQKWNTTKRNLSVGDIVLVVDQTPRNTWALGRVLDVFRDQKGTLRSIQLKTKSSVLHRPVDKLCLILESALE